MNFGTPNRPKRELTEQEAYARLSAMCARSEHSSGQVIDRMRTWGLDPEVQQQVLARLAEGRFVDDERFCRLFVDDKIKFGKWGRRKIEMALRQKGIGSDVYEPVLAAVDDERYLEVLRPLLEAKKRTVKADTDYQRFYKLLTYGIGRGFDVDLVRQCLEDIEK